MRPVDDKQGERQHGTEKLGMREEARELTGIKDVLWLSEFPRLFHRLMCEAEHVYLNSNEHKRAVIEVKTREARFVRDTMARYPLHDYQRNRLLVVKDVEQQRCIDRIVREPRALADEIPQ